MIKSFRLCNHGYEGYDLYWHKGETEEQHPFDYKWHCQHFAYLEDAIGFLKDNGINFNDRTTEENK